MKKSEYLRELKGNLKTKLSSEELNDILSDYESFFHAGNEDGKTDDDISNELGFPAFLAKSLIEGREGDQITQDKHITLPGKRFCAYFIDAVIAIIPAFVMTVIILKSIALSTILFLAYPSPLLGALSYAGYATFDTFTEESFQTETYTNNEQLFIDDDEQNLTIDSIPIEGPDEVTVAAVDNNLVVVNRPSLIVSVVTIAGIVFYLLYSLVCTLLLKGQTIGKKIMNIKVNNSNLASVSNGSIFFREFLGKILINSIPFVPIISIFTILFTSEHKALHDMLSDTIVSDL